MKKVLSLLLCVGMLLTMTACSNGEKEEAVSSIDKSEQINAEEDVSDDNIKETEEVEEITDRYVATYVCNDSNGEAALICESGCVELVGGQAYYSDDGKYAVYCKETDGVRTLYFKQPGWGPEKILDNIVEYLYDTNSGFLVVSLDDGIYYADDVKSEFVKISNASYARYLKLSMDKKCVAYFLDELDYDDELHVLWLEDGYRDVFVDTDVVWQENFMFFSGNMLSYETDDQLRDDGMWVWNGTESVPGEPYKEYSFIQDSIIDELQWIYISPNHQYLVGIRDKKTCRYEVVNNKLTNEICYDTEEKYNILRVSDNGILYGTLDDDKLFVNTGEKKIEYEYWSENIISPRLVGMLDNTVYYTDSEKVLWTMDINTEEHKRISDDVVWTCSKNGFLYYGKKDGAFFRSDIEKALPDLVREFS